MAGLVSIDIRSWDIHLLSIAPFSSISFFDYSSSSFLLVVCFIRFLSFTNRILPLFFTCILLDRRKSVHVRLVIARSDIMATPPVRQWGVTPPISTVLPTPDELAANDELIAELKGQNNFESPAETERR